MRYCDYLHGCVVLVGSAAAALILIAAASLAWFAGTTLIICSIAWLVICVLWGLWLGRADAVQEPVRQLLSHSRPEPIFPQIEPAAVLLGRLWPVLAITLVAAISTYWIPHLCVAAAGYGVLWALAWRKQSGAVLAIEERDLVHFWIVKSPSMRPPKLVRVPAM